MKGYKLIKAQFGSVCAETGRGILKGDKCLWNVKGYKVYSQDSGEYKDFVKRNTK